MKKSIFYLLTGFVLFLLACKDDDFRTINLQHGNVENNKISFHEFLELQGNKPEVQKIKKYFQGYHSEIQNKGNQNDTLNWVIDTTQVTQIITPEVSTYTFQIIEYDTISGFRNLIIREYQNQTNVFLVHYPNGVDFENHSPSQVTVEELDNFVMKAEPQCYTLEYKCQLCGQSNCTVQPGWVLVAVECDKSPGGGGGNDNPYNPGNPYDPGTPTDPGNQPIGGGPGNDNGNNGPSPCQSLTQKLLTDTKFKDKINELKPKVYSSNFEHGYVNHNPNQNPNINSNQTNQYTPTTSNQTDHANSAPSIYESSKTGMMHTHPNRPEVMGVHSTADIKKLAVILKNRYGMNYSTNDTYVIVVGTHGVYALKVENLDNFINSYIFADRPQWTKFWLDFEKIYEKKRPIGIENNNRTNNEKAILKMLQDNYNVLGFTLYRANDNLTGWSKLSLNENGNPVETPCN